MKKVIGGLFLLSQIILAQDTWRGIPYPMNRWGVSIMGVKQTEKGNLTDASVSGEIVKGLKLNVNFLEPEDLKVDADVQIVKVDYFVLPFLNIYGIGGKLKANVKFNLGVPTISLPNLPSFPLKKSWTIEHKSEGKLYGGGALLAGEYNRIFSSIQYTYTRVEMEGDVAAKSSEIGVGRIGYVIYRDENFSITPYAGASYQKTDSSISGSIPGLEGVNYQFQMELEKITPSVGFFTNINNNFTIFVDYSFGDRDTIAIDLGYRF